MYILKFIIILLLLVSCCFDYALSLMPPGNVLHDVSEDLISTDTHPPGSISQQESQKWNSLLLAQKLEILATLELNPLEYPWLDQSWHQLYKLMQYYKKMIPLLEKAIEDHLGSPVSIPAKDVVQTLCAVKDTFMFGNIIRKIYFSGVNPHVSLDIVRLYRDFINNAHGQIKKTILEILKENIIQLTWDKAIREYAKRYYGHTGAINIVDITDFSIGGGVYKIGIELSETDEKKVIEVFLKRQHPMSYDLRDEIVYIRCQNLLLEGTDIDDKFFYYKTSQPNNNLLIAPVIPGISLDRVLIQALDENNNTLIREVAYALVKHAALSDILGRDDRKLSNSHIVLGKNKTISNLIGFDVPGLLDPKIERSYAWIVEDVRRGISESTLLTLLDEYHASTDGLSQRLELTRKWKETYNMANKKISSKGNISAIEQIIREVYADDPDTADEKIAVLHARLQRNPAVHTERMFRAQLIDYTLRRLYQQYLHKIKDKAGITVLDSLKKYLIPGGDVFCASKIESFRTALSSAFMDERKIVGRESIEDIFARIDQLVKQYLGDNALTLLHEDIESLREDAELIITECFPCDLRDLKDITAVPEEVRQILKQALAEDIGKGDVTSEAQEDTYKKAIIEAQEEGMVAGMKVAMLTFKMIDANLKLTPHVVDGTHIMPESTLLVIEGSARSIMIAERVALNFLGMLSGVATRTNSFVKETHDTNTRILDTRKTIPLLRSLQKYAVTVGGGVNHRMGLYDKAIIKDNHIAAAGSITKMVENVRAKHPAIFIEVETTTMDQVKEAFDCNVDRIMLDNMTNEQMEEAVQLVHSSELYKEGKPELEASGGIPWERIHAIAKTGVDFISIGEITKSPPIIDMHLIFEDTITSSRELRRAH